MSQFADLVRLRVADARATGLPNSTGGIAASSRALEATSMAMSHLHRSNSFCAKDERCKRIIEALAVAQTEADIRTVLTQAQSLLTTLTAEDAGVAGDAEVQQFRKQLHRLLDH